MRMHTLEERHSWKITSSMGVRLKVDGGVPDPSLSEVSVAVLKWLADVSCTGRGPPKGCTPS